MPSYPCGQSKSISSSMGVINLMSAYPCGYSVSTWSSMGLEIWLSPYPCGQSKSVWSSMGGILLSPYPCGQSKSVWSSMGVEMLISSYPSLKFHGGGKFGYHLTLVVNPSQFEVPSGWKFGYHLTLVDNPSQFEVPWGWESYPCGQSKSISSSIGMKKMMSSYPVDISGRFWNRTGTVEPNRRKSNSLRTVGTVNRWNRMQNRTGGTGTVLPSSGPSPNKLIGKNVIAFWVQCKKQIWDSSIKTCMHWQFQEALVFPSSARGRKRGWESGLGKGRKTRWQKEGIKKPSDLLFSRFWKAKTKLPWNPHNFWNSVPCCASSATLSLPQFQTTRNGGIALE